MVILLAGCHRTAPPPPGNQTAGDRLEASAIARGLLSDPAAQEPTGLYAEGTDQVCVVPSPGGYTVGVSVDYGDGQGCSASGKARHVRDRIDVQFGTGCRVSAHLDGDRLTFAAKVPSACDRLCSGRASISAVAVDRLSATVAEASALRDRRGRPLCGD